MLSDFGEDNFFGVQYAGDYSLVFFTAKVLPALRASKNPKYIGGEWVAVRVRGLVRLGLRFKFGATGRFTKRLAGRLSGYDAARAKARADRITAQTHFHTEEDIRKLWDIQSGRCLYSNKRLGRSLASATFSLDHTIALAKGGHDGPLNLALVTPAINALKATIGHTAFMGRLKIDDAARLRIRRILNARRQTFRYVLRRKSRRAER